MLSDKQKEYMRNARKRWNVKTGAVRSGKTYCDLFMIPLRLRACPKDGIAVLIGNTVGTLSRNILSPMRELWGSGLVGRLRSDETVEIFGRKCWVLGASRAEQAERLQGAGIAYAYGDEITTWSEEVFEMLKSRLDKKGAVFDGTCNPTTPDHWFRKFLLSGADIYLQEYTIDDNPFLDADFREELKKEYLGTPYYGRFILGKWTSSEGLIYANYALSPGKYEAELPEGDPPDRVVVGVDFGGTGSATAFVSAAFRGKKVYVFDCERHSDGLDCVSLGTRFVLYCVRTAERFGFVSEVRCDSAEPVLIRTLKKASAEEGLYLNVRNARKSSVSGRILLVNTLFASGRLFVSPRCSVLKKALCEARWKNGGGTRLDDGTTDIDSLDAFEYCIEDLAVRKGELV